jgi:hypothetical protein
LLGLIALGILFFLRRRKSRTAPSAEFLTVYPPPQAPFSRMDSLRSAATGNFSIDPPASYTTEKYNYPQPVVNYP